MLKKLIRIKMGCKCCKGGDENCEMINGTLPKMDFDGKNNDIEEDIKLKNRKKDSQKNFNNYNINQYTEDSDCISSDQQRNEEIFDFFNDLRNNPQNYLSEAEKYNLADIISSARDRIISENVNNLIENPFFDLFLDAFVEKTPFSKEDILNNIDNNEQLKVYKKNLYCIETPFERPNESVWNLLTENKDKALDDILFKKIDYFIVSSMYIPDKKILMVYFLFLKKRH